MFITLTLFFIIIGCGGYITDGELEEDFTKREYEYYIPTSYNETTSLPIVFVFHGSQSSSYSMRVATKFNDYAEEQNFIVVYPVGVDGYWNCNDACSESYGDNHDDIGFVDYLLTKFDTDYNIDMNRVYACGFSLGAMFTMSLALDKSDTFAAVATVAGAMSISNDYKFRNAHKIPIMIIFGMSDGSVSYDGGGTGDCEQYSIPDMVGKWASHNGCDLNPTVEDLPEYDQQYIHIIRDTYNNCSDNAETVFYKVVGGGHQWFTYEKFKASETMLEFFFRHSL